MKTRPGVYNYSQVDKVICEVCENFIEHDAKFVVRQEKLECNDYLYNSGAVYPIDNRLWNVTDVMEAAFYYHEQCYNTKPSLVSLDDAKEAINKLSDQDKKEIYKYLYHTHRCRI